MRNLRTVAYREYKVPHRLPLTATAWDTSRNENDIICAFGPTPTQPQIELKRKTNTDAEFTAIAAWDAPCPLPELESDEILLLQYFADTQTACLVLAGGDLILVREDPAPSQEKIEIVGSVDVGILAAAWASDEELLAVVTRSDTLVLMSKDFEPVTETTLTAEDLKVSKHVSVGWGKKETQFQGKRAKAMRDPTMPEVVDQGNASSQEDGKASISWRGDGAYFALNSVVADHRRVIRVFDREGKLDSASEPVDGLESALSWRPYGNLIAGIKRSSNKVEVVFFERNGLRHGEFDLRLSPEHMETWASSIKLNWNIDSSVLAVYFLDRVQLWTMGNYHYYLKQEIQLMLATSKQTRPPDQTWHPETPLRLCIANAETLMDITYLSAVSRGSVLPPHDFGTVAVIDGKILKLTPLRQAGIPPPLSFCETNTTSNIIDCAINHEGNRIAVLGTEGVDLLTWLPQSSHQPDGTTGQRFSKDFERRFIPYSQKRRYTQVEFRGNSDLAMLAYVDGMARVYISSWFDNPEHDWDKEHEVGTAVQGILVDTRCETIWVADALSTLQITDTDPHVLPPSTLAPGSSDNAIFRLPQTDNEGLNEYHEPDYHKISLSSKGRLTVNTRVLAADCSSFILTDAHLIFTTTQHLLKFVHLTDPTEMDVPENSPESDERVRSIEREAKIVTVMPSSYAVVLQMPRGNLETIYPRVLVVSGIRQHLDNLDYKTAFLACQQHQVDQNILHDYNPKAFFANIVTFIEQLRIPSRVDEFLSKLKDEDVTLTLYRDTLKEKSIFPIPNTGIPTNSSKVNKICDAFLPALSSKAATHITSIITAHVCKRPPDLTSALTLISSLHKSSSQQADDAVSHLCFLTDSTKLYNSALALYDLEVTLLIAQHSQRDPREYMPFLQNLNALPELRRCYEIDNHLKNHSQALTSLVALEAHTEAETYCVTHSLYPDALRLYKHSPSHLTRLKTLYAEYLASNNQSLHAALLYDSLANYQAAYPLYALSHHWREAMTCALLIPLSQPTLTNLATSLATTQIEEHRDYRAAAHIHLSYLSSPPTAASLLCKGSYFAEALLLLSQHFSPTTNPSISSLTKSIIDTSLATKTAEILSLITDCKTQLLSQVPRIHDLRLKKAEDPLAFYGGDPTTSTSNENDFSDTISLAATESTVANQSLFTRYATSNTSTRNHNNNNNGNVNRFGAGTILSTATRQTSKTRRKEERKRARGKKGSVYEEEYLVASVKRLIDRVNGTHEEVKRLRMGLVRRGMREQVDMVEEAMREIVDGCEKARGEVWGEILVDGGVGEDGVEGGVRSGSGGVGLVRRPRGGEGVLWDAQQEGQVGGGERREVPVVKVWKREWV